MKTYRTQLEVRGYELDSYGHVNNAVYVNYLEQARWKMLAEEQVIPKTFDEWKRWPVVAELHLQYKRPIFIGEIIEIETELKEWGRVHMVFRQTIRRGADLVLEGNVHAVMVNESGKPSTIPEEMRLRFGVPEGGLPVKETP